MITVAVMALSMMASVPFEICKELHPDRIAVCAKAEADRMTAVMETERRITVVVQPDAKKMPPAPEGEVTLAFTDATVGDENGCTLTFYKEAVTEIEIIAHEVCHCVADRKFLTPGGYDRSVTTTEVAQMESAAERCTARVVAMTKDPLWGETRRAKDVRPPLVMRASEVRK